MEKLLNRQPEPTWAIAHLFPAQGTWSEDEYLDLRTNRLLEFSDGYLEVLPMPTTSHQQIVAYLYGLLLAFVTTHDLGTVLFAPLRVRLWRGKFREPALVFMGKEHGNRIHEQFWNGADLAMEVVSGEGEDEDRRRDLVLKRREYARAKIGEYWMIDPREQRITVLRLAGKTYAVYGQFAKGEKATSALLPGFVVDVTAALRPAERTPGRRTRNGKSKRR